MKAWRPDNWEDLKLKAIIDIINRRGKAGEVWWIEAGADAMLEAQLPLLKQVYAQLCGVKLEQRRADGNVLDWYSALDESIDKLKPIIIPEEAE